MLFAQAYSWGKSLRFYDRFPYVVNGLFVIHRFGQGFVLCRAGDEGSLKAFRRLVGKKVLFRGKVVAEGGLGRFLIRGVVRRFDTAKVSRVVKHYCFLKPYAKGQVGAVPLFEPACNGASVGSEILWEFCTYGLVYRVENVTGGFRWFNAMFRWRRVTILTCGIDEELNVRRVFLKIWFPEELAKSLTEGDRYLVATVARRCGDELRYHAAAIYRSRLIDEAVKAITHALGSEEVEVETPKFERVISECSKILKVKPSEDVRVPYSRFEKLRDKVRIAVPYTRALELLSRELRVTLKGGKPLPQAQVVKGGEVIL